MRAVGEFSPRRGIALAVVTISSEMGSGAPAIGMGLAQRLHYRLIDREVITEAAHRYGLLEAKLDERKPSLVQRFDVETRRYILGTRAALCEFAEADNVVLSHVGCDSDPGCRSRADPGALAGVAH